MSLCHWLSDFFLIIYYFRVKRQSDTCQQVNVFLLKPNGKDQNDTKKTRGPKQTFYYLRDQTDTKKQVKGSKQHFSLNSLNLINESNELNMTLN